VCTGEIVDSVNFTPSFTQIRALIINSVPVFMILNIAALNPINSFRPDPTWYAVPPTI
jgi:hypothetical protein